jgi:hypothetical protein
MCIESPLKKTGFQKKNGTNPHLINMEDKNINQGITKLRMSQKLLTKVKYKNTCSIKNQSNEKTFKYKSVINKNRFREASSETQK